eukprot:g2642.t1
MSGKEEVRELELNEDELETFRQSFAMFDKDGSGWISAEELKVMLTKFGDEPTDKEMKAILERIDQNGDGRITFDEFVVVHKDRLGSGECDETEEDMMNAFKMLDTDGSGFIEVAELREVLRAQGVDLDDLDESAASMLAEADEDGDGKIDFKEFHKIWESS